MTKTTTKKFLGIDVETARERVAKLSPRELEIAGLYARGQSGKEVAAGLGISPKTLDVHRGNVVRKLVSDVESKTLVRAVLVYLAGTHGDGGE